MNCQLLVFNFNRFWQHFHWSWSDGLWQWHRFDEVLRDVPAQVDPELCEHSEWPGQCPHDGVVDTVKKPEEGLKNDPRSLFERLQILFIVAGEVSPEASDWVVDELI